MEDDPTFRPLCKMDFSGAELYCWYLELNFILISQYYMVPHRLKIPHISSMHLYTLHIEGDHVFGSEVLYISSSTSYELPSFDVLFTILSALLWIFS